MAKSDLPPPPEELMNDEELDTDKAEDLKQQVKDLRSDLKKELVPDPKEAPSYDPEVTNEQIFQALNDLYQLFSMKFDQLYLHIMQQKK